jgi:hypothetical protein
MTIGHMREKFWVVTMISNPVRYDTRYRLYKQFKKRMVEAGVNLFTVEIQQGHRDFAVTTAGDANCLQLRTTNEIWHKENAINLGVQRLPVDWKYVAWIDADIDFIRKDWVDETLQQLQHYEVVQMFTQALDLDPQLGVLQTHQGFMYSYLSGRPYGKAYSFWHPGFAWACTRKAWDAIGGLPARCIAGAADHHLALSLIGKAGSSLPGGISKGYRDYIMNIQERAERLIERDVGFVNGAIMHHFHGAKRKRFYVERWSILIGNQFDPNTDLITDWQGLLQLAGNKPKLRDEMRAYFRSRDEDSISID